MPPLERYLIGKNGQWLACALGLDGYHALLKVVGKPLYPRQHRMLYYEGYITATVDSQELSLKKSAAKRRAFTR